MSESERIVIETGAIGATLVTVGEFARFVREEKYFDARYWEHGEGPPATGGDEVLRRIAYRLSWRNEPVQRITWYEAQAYCRSRGGRLPHVEECRNVRERMTGAGRDRSLFSKLAFRLARGRRQRSRASDAIPEWCDDWYNASARRPSATPGPLPLRAVVGEDISGVIPSHAGAAVGFRLVVSAPERRRSLDHSRRVEER